MRLFRRRPADSEAVQRIEVTMDVDVNSNMLFDTSFDVSRGRCLTIQAHCDRPGCPFPATLIITDPVGQPMASIRLRPGQALIAASLLIWLGDDRGRVAEEVPHGIG